ncbi:MAG: ankyrin repeat domain-containing protein [Candidatus Omnitrophica bacterium]|nr:ankyrin repeat domain-containing protein [Candidatus Omnitrophota bacterium]
MEGAANALSLGVDPNTPSWGNHTPLHTAAIWSSTEVVRALIDSGADLETSDFVKQTPLHKAVIWSDEEMVQLLSSDSKVLEMEDHWGRTAWEIAKLRGREDIAELLSKIGAVETERAQWGPRRPEVEYGITNPLVMAAHLGDRTKVLQLLERNISPNIREDIGRSALHFTEDTEIIEALIDYGADPNLRDDQDRSPLMMSCYWGWTDAAECLLVHGANIREKPKWRESFADFVALSGYPDTYGVLIDHGFDPNSYNSNVSDSTPLTSAAANCSLSELRILLEHGADINMPNAWGMTPYYLAKSAGYEEMCEALLEWGADPDIPDIFGLTPNEARALMELREQREPQAASATETNFDPNAIVLLFDMELDVAFPPSQDLDVYPFVGFAIGDGSYILTSWHTADRVKQRMDRGELSMTMVASPHYGDLFECELIGFDQKNDIALFQANWESHPALELGTAEDIRRTHEVTIAGYPSFSDSQPLSDRPKEVYLETLPLIDWDPDANDYALAAGGGKFVGPGWSGAPMIDPTSGRAIGLFGKHDFKANGDHYVYRNLFGNDVLSIRALLERHSISSDSASVSPAPRPEDAEENFQEIMRIFGHLLKRDYFAAMSSAYNLQKRKEDSCFAYFLNGWSEIYFHSGWLRDRVNQGGIVSRVTLPKPFERLEAALRLSGVNTQSRLQKFLNVYLTPTEGIEPLVRGLEKNEVGDPFADLVVFRKSQSNATTALGAFNLAYLRLRDIVKENPNSPSYFSLLGEMNLQLGEYDQAAEAFRVAWEKTEDPVIAFKLALALEKAGKIEEARETHEWISDGENRDASAHYYMANFLLDHYPEDLEQAEDAFAKGYALSGKDHDPWVEQVRQKLRHQQLEIEIAWLQKRHGSINQPGK